jgi:penicillin-binding protein 2
MIDDNLFIEEPKTKLFLSRSKKSDWVEESTFFDHSGIKKDDSSPKDFVGFPITTKKINIFFGLILFGLLILLFKTAYLQTVKGDYLKTIAEKNRIRFEKIKAERGIIYDSHLSPLVRNIPTFSLFAVPSDLPRDSQKREEISKSLQNIIGDNFDEILNKLVLEQAYSFQPVLLKYNIDYEKAMLLMIESVNMPGIKLEIGSKRQYLEDGKTELKTLSMSHIIGYLGKITKEELLKFKELDYDLNDYIGKTGVEAFYERILKGIDGERQVEVDAQGEVKRVIATKQPIKGNDIILTIDINLQKRLEETLNQYLKKYKKTKGAAILLNPNNGDILALVSLPTFDANLFARGASESEYQSLINDPTNPLFFRAIAGTYPSGSTIKPIIAAAALEEKIINRNTSFLSTGGIWYDKWFFPDWKLGGHGVTNVTRAIAESINTFFYIIGGGYKDFNGLGAEKIVKYAQLFGLGNPSGIDLVGEASGLLPTPTWKQKTKNEPWYIGDTYHLSIGQGDILVTPLQIAQATAVFANKGTLYKPRIVKEIINSKDEDLVQPSEIVRKNFINLTNIEIVRNGLRQAVLSGSAQKLKNLTVTSAGKTGTAEHNKNKAPHAWFTGFAPYENPEVVITVLVEEGGEGSGIALDVALDFLKWYFNNK